MSDSAQGLKNALGFGISLLAAEHFISAGMSSPWSVAKFAETDTDVAQVWRLFFEAGAASVVSSGVIAFLLRDWEVFWWSLGGVGLVMVFVGSEYKRALDGTL